MKSAAENKQARAGRDFFVALSVANMALLLPWSELFYQSADESYWFPSYSSRTYLAALVSLGILTLPLWIGSKVYRRTTNPVLKNTLLACFFLAALGPLNYLRLALSIHERALNFLKDHLLVVAVVVGAVLIMGIVVLRYRFRVAQLVYNVFLVLVPFAFLNIVQTLWYASTINPPDPTTQMVTATSERATTARVLLIVFDELDYSVIFHDRQTTIRYPELDRFKQEAFFATNCQEVSESTLTAIPSMLLGKRVTGATPRGADRLSIRFADSDTESDWTDHPTLFSEAAELYVRSGIVGYYHPYSRLFAGNYETCSDWGLNSVQLDEEDTFLEIVKAQLFSMVPLNLRRGAIITYRGILEAAISAANDPSLDLVYVHASVPHRPNIYDARSRSLTLFKFSKSGYFENVAAADHFLGRVRESMEQSGTWDSTTVIVTADHGWRETQIVGRKHDGRVPLLIKVAGQDQHRQYDGTFSILVLKDLTLDFLRGQINNNQQIETRLKS